MAINPTKLRRAIGFGSLARMFATSDGVLENINFQGLCMSRRNQIITEFTEAGGNVNDGFSTDGSIVPPTHSKFMWHLWQLCLRDVLIECAEFGYPLNEGDFARNYICFYMHRDLVDAFLRDAVDEDFIVHLVDAQTEQLMRGEENEALKAMEAAVKKGVVESKLGSKYDYVKQRKLEKVACCKKEKYYNCISVRFPLETLKVLHDRAKTAKKEKLCELVDDIVNNYVCVHAAAKEIGANTVARFIGPIFEKLR